MSKYSNIDYITKSGQIYKKLKDDVYFKRKHTQNKNNKYMYVKIQCKDNKTRQKRVHRLIAEMFIDNPNPKKYKKVGHKDNIKWHNTIDNLYWTDTQSNTQKAVDDGLCNQLMSVENDKSIQIAVYDVDNNLISVYGSINECNRCVKNNSKTYISQMIERNYTPRNKKYKYQKCSKEFYLNHIDIAGKLLEENKSVKTQHVFKMINQQLGYEEIFDNQKQASKICGIPQNKISHYLLNGITDEHNGWKFIEIGTTNYKKSSAFDNLCSNLNQYVVQNINSQELKVFNTFEDLKRQFGLNGHSGKDYINKNHKIMEEWQIIDYGKNVADTYKSAK